MSSSIFTARNEFDEYTFQSKVNQAMESVKRILDTTRQPAVAADVPHVYEDKYALAETMTNLTLAGQLNCLGFLGMTPEMIAQCRAWALENKSVSLRFSGKETCAFQRKQEREIEGPTTKSVQETTGSGRKKTKVQEHTTITKVTDYFHVETVNLTLTVFAGADPNAEGQSIMLSDRTGKREIKTTSEKPPRNNRNMPVSVVNVTWLFQQKAELAFSIDRSHEDCRTPRRNNEVAKALSEGTAFRNFCQHIQSVIVEVDTRWRNHTEPSCTPVLKSPGAGVFVPVAPFFEATRSETAQREERKRKLQAGSSTTETTSSSTTTTTSPPTSSNATPTTIASVHQQPSAVNFNIADTTLLLGEQVRTLKVATKLLEETLPTADADAVITVREGMMSLVVSHAVALMQAQQQALDYIEKMLEKQLLSAIGKEITPIAFAEFMKFHNMKLYKEEFAPQPFSYAVRRPGYYPEGEITIETKGADGAESIFTLTRHIKNNGCMRMALNATTQMEFGGETFLHGYLAQKFENSHASANLTLVARARQFSCFMVVLGKLGGPNKLNPTHAIIVQNKDEVLIPLLCETMPSAKEFADAIESLSPEQQGFAKAFRSMQLEGTVFAVAVIQLKPQLETLLNLPNESLTKQIKLTQQLFRLFMEHQIPSDLLRYEGSAEAETSIKLTAVQSHVDSILAMIQEAKDLEVAEAKKAAEFAKAEREQVYSMEHSMNESYGAPMSAPMMMDSRSSMAMPKMMMKRSNARAPAPTSAMRGSDSSMCELDDMSMNNFDNSVGGGSPHSAPKRVDTNKHQPKDSKDGKTDDDVVMDSEETDETAETGPAVDFTKIPAKLDQRFKENDPDGALRPTKLIVQPSWTKNSQKTLLSKPEVESLDETQIKTEKTKAFDLLDALTKSGALPIKDSCELHVIVAATHCFDRSLMDTVVVKNTDPILKMDHSGLLMAETILDRPVQAMIQAPFLPQIQASSSALLQHSSAV